MILESVSLRNFRSYREAFFPFDDGVNILCGDNGLGKTNLLEAVWMLTGIRSWRASRKQEVVRWDTPLALIKGTVFSYGREYELALELPAAGKSTAWVNGIKKRRQTELSEHLRCVLFSPEDLALIKGPAAGRREFLDAAISQLRPRYEELLVRYLHLLESKSRLLKQEDPRPAPQLVAAFDDQLASLGALLIGYRAKFCRGLAEGCVFKGNGPGNGHSVCYNCKVVNCTLFGGQAGASSSNRGLVFNEGSTDLAKGLTILNSIVLGNYQARAVTNCYFLTGAVDTLTVNLSGTAPKESGIVTGSASVIDEDGKPVAGAAVIDTGMNDICPAALAAGLDLAGTRRILNSAIDIGAREYDWGVPWGAAIGGRRLAIDDMPSVPVAMTWTGNGNGAAYDFTATVTGAGTLVVTANGEEVGTVTAADGAKALKFTSELAANSLLFAYDGPEADGVTLSGFSNQAPFVVMLR